MHQLTDRPADVKPTPAPPAARQAARQAAAAPPAAPPGPGFPESPGPGVSGAARPTVSGSPPAHGFRESREWARRLPHVEEGIRRVAERLLSWDRDSAEKGHTTTPSLGLSARLAWIGLGRDLREDFASWIDSIGYIPGEQDDRPSDPAEQWEWFLVECRDGSPLPEPAPAPAPPPAPPGGGSPPARGFRAPVSGSGPARRFRESPRPAVSGGTFTLVAPDGSRYIVVDDILGPECSCPHYRDHCRPVPWAVCEHGAALIDAGLIAEPPLRTAVSGRARS